MPESIARFTASELYDLSVHAPSDIERRLAQMLLWRGAGVSDSERRSWRNSLPALAADLVESERRNLAVMLEYGLPRTSKRADAVIAGHDPTTGAPKYLVIELKQWNRASTAPGETEHVEVPGAPYSPILHPSVQVAAYVEYMTDFIAALAPGNINGATISGAAYLHNASRLSVESLLDNPKVPTNPLFTADRRGEFIEFLREYFSNESGHDSADLLLGAAIRPSKQLLDAAAEEIRDREQFVLLDEQKIAYNLVLRAVERSYRDTRKTAVVISGGPGSGKSVIALALLGELARRGRSVLHATGSRSFTRTLRKIAGHRKPQIQKLFTYFNSFVEAEPNELDVLINDEAHRIRETSIGRYTPQAIRIDAGRQVDELLSAARVPVFLLDEHQVVRPGEMGSVAEIETAARRRGIEIEHVDLNGEFRLGGSSAFIEWVQLLLGLVPGSPVPWSGDGAFFVDVVGSPAEMEARLRNYLIEGVGARITAGYCWPWSDADRDHGLVKDVRIGDWAKPWNVKGDRAVGDAPPAALWATQDGGFEQVGCVYTAQGFEYPWNGVILGPDLVWRDDRFVTRRSLNRDPDFRSVSRVSDTEFSRLVRNVYKVLLTRGLVGTLLYSVDEETNAKLRELVRPTTIPT